MIKTGPAVHGNELDSIFHFKAYPKNLKIEADRVPCTAVPDSVRSSFDGIPLKVIMYGHFEPSLTLSSCFNEI